ncbi:MAG: hypothetical protein JWP89_198, partial [Schlesneria sp.]|nr:hypothetical protein [Schlesneria sp.]
MNTGEKTRPCRRLQNLQNRGTRTDSRAISSLVFSVSAVSEIVEAFLRLEFLDELPDSVPEGFDGA